MSTTFSSGRPTTPAGGMAGEGDSEPEPVGSAVTSPPWPDTATINPAGDLELGGVPLATVADRFGTPVYVFDVATFARRARAYRRALSRRYAGEAQVHYACKAFLNVAVAQLAMREGLLLDAVSIGEVQVGRSAGVPGHRIHLHGNAKTAAELREARRLEVGTVIVDSVDELRLLAEVVPPGAGQPVMLRLAPDVTVDTHPHIATGLANSKFGIPIDRLAEAAHLLESASNLRYEGLHCHVGSQITDLAPYRSAVQVLVDAAAALHRRHGWTTHVISPGGGLGIAQTADDVEPDIDAYVGAVATEVTRRSQQHGLPLPKLVLEPGRSIVGPAMVALYQVVATKRLTASGGPGQYIHVDGGIGDNPRPAMYGARLDAAPVTGANRRGWMDVHLSGRYCESSDVLARNLVLPNVKRGDVLAVPAAGAYTLSMASNYNHVPRPPVVFVSNRRAWLVTRRETHRDLTARDLPLTDPLPVRVNGSAGEPGQNERSEACFSTET